MENRAGRIILVVIGVILVVVGAVFAGQGLDLIPGSSMTGDSEWFYIGLVMVIVGVILAGIGLRRRRGGRTR